MEEERNRQQKEEEEASNRLIEALQAEEQARRMELERQALGDEALARQLTDKIVSL